MTAKRRLVSLREWKRVHPVSNSEPTIKRAERNFLSDPMRIHQIRNATVVVEAAGQRILVDPMLGAPGTLPPYAVLRFHARMNPLTGLPENTAKSLDGITAGIISHTHFGMDCDHLDRAGAKLLADTKVPVFCNRPDENNLRRRGLQAVPLAIACERPFVGGTITAFDAAHGHCIMRKLMGPGGRLLSGISRGAEPLHFRGHDSHGCCAARPCRKEARHLHHPRRKRAAGFRKADPHASR